MSIKQRDKLRAKHFLLSCSLVVPLWTFISLSNCFLLTYDPGPQVSAPRLTWMRIAHVYSQGHPRLNLDTVFYNMLGVDSDGEEGTRGPWDWD